MQYTKHLLGRVGRRLIWGEIGGKALKISWGGKIIQIYGRTFSIMRTAYQIAQKLARGCDRFF